MPSNVRGEDKRKLMPIEGSPPDLFHPPQGCGYFARCPYAMEVCEKNLPEPHYVSEKHFGRCWLHESLAPRVSNPAFHQAGQS